MYHLFCPDLSVDSIHNIDLTKLKQRGLVGLVVDLDNTLVAWDGQDVAAEVTEWLKKVHNEEFKIVLVSNNNQRRVEKIANIMGVPFISRALKPAKAGFKQAMQIMNLPATNIAVIGDQLFTDVLGGNRMGLYTILVKSLSPHEFFGTRITRLFEKMVFRILKDKGLLK